MEWRTPSWSSASVLVYLGGLTVLSAGVASLAYLAGSNGKAGLAGWGLLILVGLGALAEVSRRRERWTVAGIFAFGAVVAWIVFLGLLWTWWGWAPDNQSSPFDGFSVSLLGLELLVLVAVRVALRRYRFPLIAAIGVVVGWVFVTDLVSNGGSWTVVVTLLVGLAYLAAGSASSSPTAFWFHLGSGLLIGGSFIYWWHAGDWHWGLIGVASLAYVWLARATGRSSWAVLGAVGLLITASHLSVSWSNGGSFDTYQSDSVYSAIPSPGVLLSDSTSTGSGWVPLLVFAFTGFLLVVLGLWVRRRPSE